MKHVNLWYGSVTLNSVEGKERGEKREDLNGNGKPAVRRATEQSGWSYLNSDYLHAVLQQGTISGEESGFSIDGLKSERHTSVMTFKTYVFFNRGID